MLLAVGYTLLLAWNRGEKIEGEAPGDARVHTPALDRTVAGGESVAS